jgi:ubiquinone/menaquinone biosynthesis C-methylase UbiE
MPVAWNSRLDMDAAIDEQMTDTQPNTTDVFGEWSERVSSNVDRFRYLVQHGSLALSFGMTGRLWSLLLSPRQQRPSADAIALLQQRYRELLDRDLANVGAGFYPRTLLYQYPMREYVRVLPHALLDVPSFLWRSYRGKHDDLPADVDLSHYPSYYRRTFHWQTDGWLSDTSARLYDASVEFLFGGTADIMRRMAIPPVVEECRGRTRPAVLDVGCGTGRFLLQLGTALPGAKLYGLDLSPYYLKHAGRVLENVTDVSLIGDNAERMPLADSLLDVVTSIFLFHELPRDVRRNVMREAFRVLKPGGRFVVCDSAQLSDSGELKDILNWFPASYHEPYYKGYLRDDLAGIMEECGFAVESSTAHFVSKVVIGRKRIPSVRTRAPKRRVRLNRQLRSERKSFTTKSTKITKKREETDHLGTSDGGTIRFTSESMRFRKSSPS